MNAIKLFGFIVLICSLVSCDDEDETTFLGFEETDFLVFGHFHGECWGERCVETYKLTEDKLYEDKLDNYASTSFEFYELDHETFEMVEDLSGYIPDALFNETDNRIGCPDCGDWGGLNVSISKDGVLRHWLIDKKKDNVPAYLHELIDKIQEKIALING